MIETIKNALATSLLGIECLEEIQTPIARLISPVCKYWPGKNRSEMEFLIDWVQAEAPDKLRTIIRSFVAGLRDSSPPWLRSCLPFCCAWRWRNNPLHYRPTSRFIRLYF